MTTMLDLEWTLVQQVICTLFHVLAISSTSFRLSYRLHTRRLWLEDAWAALALVGDALCLALVWVHWPYGQPEPSWPSPLLYIAASLPADVVWLARMSILFSIIRLTNPKSPQRRIACATAVSFLVFWFAIFVQRMVRCARAHCGSDRLTGILQITAALLSDVALIVLPIWSFGASKLSRDRKVTIVAVYIATVVITGAVIFDSVEAIYPAGRLALLSMHLKAALSLTISNLFVITSCSWRLLGCGNRPRDRSAPASASNNAMTFTTVDLNTCVSGTIPTTTDTTNSTTNSNHELSPFPCLAGYPLLPLSRLATDPRARNSEPRWPLPFGTLTHGGDLALAFSAGE